jgi:hypothetical protein
MKKTIKIEVPDKLPGLESVPQEGGEGAEAIERFDPRRDAAQRRALAIANAIAKRAKKPRVEETQLVLVEEEYTAEEKQAGKGVGKDDKVPKKKSISIEIDLTQKQIDNLPIGLRKMLV